ncbi:chorismate mutase [Streptomyces massasporeus]|uniref:chorismate mutase n=1 Tax=Streptomyces massasporeus TaxID=67324 RepID=UPI00369A0CE0
MSNIRPRTAVIALTCIGAAALVACGGSHIASTRPAQTRPAAVSGSASGKALGMIVRLAAERVMTADTVAAAKWGRAQSIDDPAREKKVLDNAATQATKLGIDQSAVQRIFEDQITANKTVQRALFTQWQAQPTEQPTHRPDLATQVRPVLDRVDSQLLSAIQQAQPLLSSPECGALLEQEQATTARSMGLDAVHKNGLAQALAHTCQTR